MSGVLTLHVPPKEERNIGAQISAKYEEERQRLKESMNLPEVCLLDVDESIENIERERRRIIDNQAVKARRIDSWIKAGGIPGSWCEDMTDEEREAVLEEAALHEVALLEASLDSSTPEEEDPDGEIVYDSILKNKEKTKSYWEKLMLAAKLASCNIKKNGIEGEKDKEESVIEREIRMQREREEALADERRAALKLTKYSEEGPNSIPTTDEGNFSESGSEDKEPIFNCNSEAEDSFNHQRSASFESMSSGHSSSSERMGKRSGMYIVEQQPQDSLSPYMMRNSKETPIEKEIRLVREREEELRKEKASPTHTGLPKSPAKSQIETKRQDLTRCAKASQAPCNDRQQKSPGSGTRTEPKNDEIKAELETISLKKCVSMSNLPLVSLQNDSYSSKPVPPVTMKNFRKNPSQQSLNHSSSPKLFVPNKGQKGLMKRFLESHGRLNPTFTVSPVPPTPTPTVTKPFHTEMVSVNPKERKQENVSTTRRPGYRSAEDKIQMELKEMKRREAEHKQERARLLGRSQPNLQDIDDDREIYMDGDEFIGFSSMGKLRSALSNPNLLATKPYVQKAPTKRRSALIDAWENRIRKEQ